MTRERIKALFAGLGKNSNTAIVEFQVRPHQSKAMSSADEEPLADLLEPNTSIIKLGVDCRNQLIEMKLDKKTNANRNGASKKIQPLAEQRSFTNRISFHDGCFTFP